MLAQRRHGAALTRAAALLLCTAAAVSKAAAFEPTIKAGTDYTWTADTAVSDEFSSGDAKWGRQLGDWQGTAPGFFQDANSAVASGALQLTATATSAAPPGVAADCDCGFEGIATGMVVSKAATQYGFYEIRATVANAQVMSSFWLQGETGEINIFESVLSNGKTPRHSTNYHCFDPEDATATTSGPKELALSLDMAKEHTFGLDWQDQWTKFYVDGELVRTQRTQACMRESMNVVLSLETVPEHGIPADLSGAKTSVAYFRRWARGPKKAATTQAPATTQATTQAPATTTTKADTAACAAGETKVTEASGTCPALPTAGFHRGTKIATFTGVDTAEECGFKCATNSKCVYWMVTPTDRCLLKSSKTSFVKRAGFTHGDRSATCAATRCAAAPTECTKIADNGYYKGARYASFTSEQAPDGDEWTWEQCAAKCAGDDRCNYWKVNTRSVKHACQLLAEKSDDFVSKSYIFHGVTNAACKAAPTPTPVYTVLTDGRRCSDAGMAAIASVEDCDRAAEVLDADDTEARTTGKNNRPEGCYIATGSGSLWFATNAANKGNGGTGSRHQVCKRAGANTGEAKALPSSSGGSIPRGAGAGSDEAPAAGTSGSTAGSYALPVLGSLLVVAAVVAAAVTARKSKLITAAEAEFAANSGDGGNDFDDCVNAMEQGVAVDAVSASSADQGFEANGFVLSDEGDSVRINSVRRANPTFRSSIFSEAEAVGPAAIDEDTSM